MVQYIILGLLILIVLDRFLISVELGRILAEIQRKLDLIIDKLDN